MEITGNVFDQNASYSGAGGGAIQTWGTGSTISGNTFTGNQAHSYVASAKGGAVLVRAGSENPVSGSVETIIQGNVFDGNSVADESSSTARSGGAICVYGNGLTISAQITANEFTGNHAPDFGGAVSMDNVDEATVVNNLFVGNEASGDLGGGAIFAQSTDAVVVNNTFVENYVGNGTWPSITPAAYGGAVHIRASDDVELVNNIFCDNLALYGNGVAATAEAAGSISYCDAHPGTQYSDQYYASLNPTLAPGTGLLYTDPLLCGSEYWLASSPNPSPCRGTGQNPSANPIVPTSDKDGVDRPGSNGTTDMGAHENDNRQCP